VSSELSKIIEAILFAAETPLSREQLRQILETYPPPALTAALEELRAYYSQADHAFTLEEVAGGFSFRTKGEYAFWLRRLKREQSARLSPKALETLAIVAYKQPIMKAEIERIRGVDVSAMLRALMEKDLVRTVGRQALPGKPLIYGTTKKFLEVFGLNELGDLPTLEELRPNELGGLPTLEELRPLSFNENPGDVSDDEENQAPGPEALSALSWPQGNGAGSDDYPGGGHSGETED
jgi:segregation and condensation protein B